MANNKPKESQYSEYVPVKFQKAINDILEAKALENHTSVSEVVRTAVIDYINKNVSDTEVLFTSIAEMTSHVKKLENKMDLLCILSMRQMKEFLPMFPDKKDMKDETVDYLYEGFLNRVKSDLRKDIKLLEKTILDAYEG